MPGNAGGLVAELPLLGGPLSQPEKPFSHRGRAATAKEKDLMRGNKEGRRNVSDEPF